MKITSKKHKFDKYQDQQKTKNLNKFGNKCKDCGMELHQDEPCECEE